MPSKSVPKQNSEKTAKTASPAQKKTSPVVKKKPAVKQAPVKALKKPVVKKASAKAGKKPAVKAKKTKSTQKPKRAAKPVIAQKKKIKVKSSSPKSKPYYTQQELDGLLGGHKVSGDHDGRYSQVRHNHGQTYAAPNDVAALSAALTSHKTSEDHSAVYAKPAQIASALNAHKTSPFDHDGKYSKEGHSHSGVYATPADVTAASSAIASHKGSTDHDGRYALRVICGNTVNPATNNTNNKAIIPLDVPNQGMLERIQSAGARIILSGFALDFSDPQNIHSPNITFSNAAISNQVVEVNISDGTNNYSPNSAPWNRRCVYISVIISN